MSFRDIKATGLGTKVLFMTMFAIPFLATGCADPVEPGSDLPAEAPPAVLSEEMPMEPAQPDESDPELAPVEGTQLIGTFNVQGRLDSPTGDTIDLAFVGQVTQEGDIENGDAEIDLEIVSTDGQEATLEAPAVVSSGGRFEGRVVDLLVSKNFSALLADDVYTDLYFEAQIISTDCFHGGLGLQLKDAQITDVPTPVSIRLNGTFTATREGADCDFGEETAGGESGETGEQESVGEEE